MSTTLSPRPLSVFPFIAVDAGLLLTAGMIAWFNTGELTGGPLLAVVVCVGLGAVLAVLPFVINDAHYREAALAERQRELAELVTASNAHASRWGTQWAAAATGLQDAADLATRSLATAERLPVMFQETADALTQKLAEAEDLAQARGEHSAQQESAFTAQLGAHVESLRDQQAALLAHQLAQTGAQDSALGVREAALAGQVATLADQMALLTGKLSSLTAQVAQNATQASALTAREAALASQMASFASQFASLTDQVSSAEVRLGSTTAALTGRLAEVDAAVGGLVAQLQRAAEVAAVVAPKLAASATPALVSVPAPVAVAAPAPVSVADEVAVEIAAPPTPGPARTDEPEVAPVPVIVTAGAPVEITFAEAPVSVALVTPVALAPSPRLSVAAPGAPTAAAKTPIRSDLIMDPFIIPANGYAALADAMDLGDA